MSNFDRKLIYKVYSETDTYLGVLDDVISDLSIRREVNGGDGAFTITLSRKIDDFEEDTIVKFNNRIKVYLQDEHNPDGDQLVAYGYITSYSPKLSEHNESIEITCLSATSKLKNSFYRTGTASIAADLGVELLSKRADEMMEEIIDHYRLIEANSMISNDYSNADATPDNSGGAISFDHRFFNMKHLDAIRESSKFLPRNKDGGYFFYWRISTDGKLYVKNISTTADHVFIIGKHITAIDGRKTIEGVINRVYFWNEKPEISPEYIKLTSEDTDSQDNYDTIASYITDSKITTAPAASLLSASRVYDKKDPKVNITIDLNGEYDLASIQPGQTCKILNAKENPFKIGSDTVLFIHSIEYKVDSATLEVSNAHENFEDMVEEERIRLDQEITWFGKVTQMLTAAQLSPANRAWTTTITFTATTGADAWRQIDWTAGLIYIPAGESGTAAQRVIDIGNTGLMSSGSKYYIYLDEEILPTTAAVVTRTGTSKQGGDILGDDGSPAWTNDQYKGYVVEIGSQKKIIKSNTASVLTLEDRWTVADQTAQTYTISKLSLSSTASEETAMSDNRVVFTNAEANANTDSEAVLKPVTTPNIIVDGATQVAKKSISNVNIIAGTIRAEEIEALTITAAEIKGETITADKLSFTAFDVGVDTLDDVVDGSTYGRVLQTNMTAGQILLSACSGTLDNIANGTYAKVLTTDITAGHVQLVSCGGDSDDVSEGASNYFAGASGADFIKGTDTLDNVVNGATYAKVLLTDINAGHITLVERTVSLRSISLNASVPHIKVAYNGTDVIQMAVVGTEPKLEVYCGGYIRTRLNKNGLYFFSTSGVQRAYLYGDPSANRLIVDSTLLYCSGNIYSGNNLSADNDIFSGRDIIASNDIFASNDLLANGGLFIGLSGSGNFLVGDGTNITFGGGTSAHLLPNGAYDLGSATRNWRHLYISGNIYMDSGDYIYWGSEYIRFDGAKWYLSDSTYIYGYLRLAQYAVNPTTETGSMWWFSTGGTNQFRGEPSAGWLGSFDMTAV